MLRSCVVFRACPICRQWLASVRGCQAHFQAVCGKRITPALAAALGREAAKTRKRLEEGADLGGDERAGGSLAVQLLVAAARARGEIG